MDWDASLFIWVRYEKLLYWEGNFSNSLLWTCDQIRKLTRVQEKKRNNDIFEKFLR